MLNIYICEDNEIHLKTICEIVKNTIMIENYDMELTTATDNPVALLQCLKDEPSTGIYFLDVDLNVSMNGIQLAEKIREYDPWGFIIFITSYLEFSKSTFEYKVEALDYIEKNDKSRMRDSITQCLKTVNNRYLSRKKDSNNSFIIKHSDLIIIEEYNDIYYFELSEKSHKIVMHTVSRRIEFRGSLKNTLLFLNDRFYRCSGKCIINIDKIERIDVRNKTLHLIMGDECLASGRLLKTILKQYKKLSSQKEFISYKE